MGILISKTYILILNLGFLVVLCLFLKPDTYYPKTSHSYYYQSSNVSKVEGCKGLHNLKDNKHKCLYIKYKNPCESQGYFDYLYLFYCICGRWPLLGWFLVLLWLLVLFYLLGDTASVYFCSSLESLSTLLKLSPTIAGVTLLSFGNGAPDVFASIVSFQGSGAKGVGFNSVLGGATFVSCVVVGVISIVMGSRRIAVYKLDFVRDVCFFFLGLSVLLLIMIFGKINLWGALGFTSLYFVYILVVYITHSRWKIDRESELGIPILSSIEKHAGIPVLCSRDKESEVIIIDREVFEANGYKEIGENESFGSKSRVTFANLLYILQFPLYLPRRLTIPVVSEEKWSKPFAVISVTLAPVLLVALCCYQKESSKTILVLFVSGGVVGVILGILTFVTTQSSSPPKKFLLPWLVGGFVMSVSWSYLTAQELVALLVSCGYILGISPSILGLTVLAWGNSIGDLVTNVALAVNGGHDGTQIAISGCYAGPIFNTLVGLGLSLLFPTWQVYPSSLLIPTDPHLLETLAFLVGGLVWALVVLPSRKMKVDRFLGLGLLAIYMASISLRLLQTMKSL